MTHWNPRQDTINKYLAVCKAAAENDEVFSNFKRNPDYTAILEHTSKELGEQYLKILEANGDDWLMTTELKNDLIGNPSVKSVGNYFCSPTTVQYLAITSQIQKKYVKDCEEKEIPDGLSIVEIGGGYGGQCWALSKLCCWGSYDIIDLPEVNLLQQKYLNKIGIADASFWNSSNYKKCERFGNWHFFISNYALSEIKEPLQTEYIKNIAQYCEHGYITCNAPLNSVHLLKEKFSTYKESPDIEGERKENFIITW